MAELSISQRKQFLRNRIRERLRPAGDEAGNISQQAAPVRKQPAERQEDRSRYAGTDAALLDNVKKLPTYAAAQTVFCFVGVRQEIDTRRLIERMLAEGKRVYVPRCGMPGQMEACALHSLSELKKGKFGIPEPDGQAETIAAEELELALLPCLAVRPDGLRLGQGGGYYDRYLERFRGVSAALCREDFVMEEIPSEPHDRYVDFIVTERGVRRCSGCDDPGN